MEIQSRFDDHYGLNGLNACAIIYNSDDLIRRVYAYLL